MMELFEAVIFMLEVFMVGALAVILYKLGYRWIYLGLCERATGEIVKIIPVSQTVEVNQSSDYERYNTFRMSLLTVQFDLNDYEYMEAETQKPVGGSFELGDAVEVTYMDDPSKIMVDFKADSNKELRTLLIVFLVMAALEGGLQIWHYSQFQVFY